MIDSVLVSNSSGRGFRTQVKIFEDYEVFHTYKHNMYYYDQVKKALSSSGSTLFVHLTGAGKSYVALQAILYFTRINAISDVVVMGQNKGVLYTWEKLFSSNSEEMKKALPLSVSEGEENFARNGSVSHKFTNSDGKTEVFKFGYRILTYAAALNNKDNLVKSKTLYILDEPQHLADEENIWHSLIEVLKPADYILGLTATSTVPVGETEKLFATKVNGMRLSDLDGFNDMNVSYVNYKDDDPTKEPVVRREPIMPKLEIFNIPIAFNTTGTAYAEFMATLDYLKRIDVEAYSKVSKLLPDLKKLFSRKELASIIQHIFSRTPRKIVVSASSGDFKAPATAKLVSELTGISPSNIYVVSSSTSDEKRNAIFDLFKDPTQEVAIINYEVVSEGVHLQRVNGVLILGQTSSSRKYIQAIGRMLSADFRNQFVPVVDLTTSLFDMYRKYVDSSLGGGDRPEIDVDDLDYLFRNISMVAWSPDFPDGPAKKAFQSYISIVTTALKHHREMLEN